MPAGVLLLASAVSAQLEQVSKFSLWQRGDHKPCADGDAVCDIAKRSFLRHAPVLHLRGGADGCSPATGTCEPTAPLDLDALRAELGHEFSAALDRNEEDHAKDCDQSCEHFYCGASRDEYGPVVAPPVDSVHMGSVPPEDFSGEFQFPLDLIKVTTVPLIPPDEAEAVVATALGEGLANNEWAIANRTATTLAWPAPLTSTRIWNLWLTLWWYSRGLWLALRWQVHER